MPRQQFTPEQHSVRLLKVGERVRHVLSDIFARQQVHDDVLTAHSVSVTEVRMTPDLRQAKVYVKPLLGTNEDEVVRALRQNTAFLQREVARRLGLKFAPKLQFRADETFEEASRIDRLLDDPRVKRDLDADEERDGD
ncbi:ribosome-binding factor A [Novosphingobium marinum]|uniref:Ribosome-binding factor A n=1 Tax=Novosphingobium marinum TaxID=1514948 RepID=A0A7Y9XVV5_9SPHN|nr:30S ribosome-binding factor RbfA [Novosphingobium marinum]NYH95462.1 ribosome-binding factor A [Novosphingobium marinum]GGC27276.1 ribosome-binding factor A [Novosphingobium marinum]